MTDLSEEGKDTIHLVLSAPCDLPSEIDVDLLEAIHGGGAAGAGRVGGTLKKALRRLEDPDPSVDDRRTKECVSFICADS